MKLNCLNFLCRGVRAQWGTLLISVLRILWHEDNMFEDSLDYIVSSKSTSAALWYNLRHGTTKKGRSVTRQWKPKSMKGVKRQGVKLISAANYCAYSYKACERRLYILLETKPFRSVERDFLSLRISNNKTAILINSFNID